jgi:hypothetical protein
MPSETAVETKILTLVTGIFMRVQADGKIKFQISFNLVAILYILVLHWKRVRISIVQMNFRTKCRSTLHRDLKLCPPFWHKKTHRI